jgi:OFA family oxalate/formate antiporter-like MFS transporter
MNRWLVVIGAVLVQICLGAIYSWGALVPTFKADRAELALLLQPDVLGIDASRHAEWKSREREIKATIANTTGAAAAAAKKSFAEFLKNEVSPHLGEIDDKWRKQLSRFSTTATKAVFAVTILVFAFTTPIAGRWQDRIGPRPVALIGCMLLALGYGVASLNTTSFAWVLGWIGFVGGIGIGFAYVCPLAACVKWFPESRGLITGIAVAGFGAGAYIYINLAGDWGNLINRGGLPFTFQVFAASFVVAGGLGSLLLSNPAVIRPESEPDSSSCPSSGPTETSGPNLTQAECIVSPLFWMIWAAFLFSSGSGLMVIASIKDYALTEGGLTSSQGDQAVALLALFNGLGRILWGYAGQAIRPQRALVILTLVQAAILAAIPVWAEGSRAVTIAACCIGFQFGGNVSLFPLLTGERFGQLHMGANYGAMLTAYGLGGALMPLTAGGIKDLLGSYGAAFWISSGVTTVAMLILIGVSGRNAADKPAAWL